MAGVARRSLFSSRWRPCVHFCAATHVPRVAREERTWFERVNLDVRIRVFTQRSQRLNTSIKRGRFRRPQARNAKNLQTPARNSAPGTGVSHVISCKPPGSQAHATHSVVVSISHVRCCPPRQGVSQGQSHGHGGRPTCKLGRRLSLCGTCEPIRTAPGAARGPRARHACSSLLPF